MTETSAHGYLSEHVVDYAIPLGDDHALLWVALAATDEHPAVPEYGAIVTHPGTHGATCAGGYILLAGSEQAMHDPDAQTWTVESRAPLTLSPSLLCRICGDHGFVREGRWVAA